MPIYTQVVNVFGQALYPTDPQVTIPFVPKRIRMVNEDAADAAFVSMSEAKTDDVHLLAGAAPGSAYDTAQQVRRLWLRTDAAGADPTNVRIYAES